MTGPEPVKVPITPGEVIPAEGSIEWPGPVETACTRSLDLDFVAVSKIAATGEKALETQAPATSFASSWPAATCDLGLSQVGCGYFEEELAHRVPGRAHRCVQGGRVDAQDPGPRTAVVG